MKHYYAHNLKILRHQAGLTQSDMAHLLECSQTYYCQMEAGKREPTVKQMCCLSVILNVPVTELFKVSTASAIGAMQRRIKTMPGCGLTWRDREKRVRNLNDLKKRLEAYVQGIYAA